MATYTAEYTHSAGAGDATGTGVTFGVDVSQSTAFLSATIIPSSAFARTMLTLGRVVRMHGDRAKRDHADYQAWVTGQYLIELPEELRALELSVPRLLGRRKRLAAEVARLAAAAAAAMPGDALKPERRKFWDWLYAHNREAWIVLDPIVSVQHDATFFEAFSSDESTYARVTLPHAVIDVDHPFRPGTTNIDFSVALERELSRARSYRPLHLTVGADSVGVSTDVSKTVERKIDLPESWVRGLVEVQAALSLVPTSITVSSAVLADILARLAAQRETEGPRSLVFDLVPGEPIRIIVEPWGDVFSDSSSIFSGPAARSIRVWGRRRLRVLEELLPHVNSVTVHLLDSGMPSFWSIESDGVGLMLGISGWTTQDWAGRARFAALAPATNADPAAVREASTVLRERQFITADDLAASLNTTSAAARTVLQSLCIAGQAMYVVESATYRWRVLYPGIDLAVTEPAGLEERKGVELARSGAVRMVEDIIADGARMVTAEVTEINRSFGVTLHTDVDGRVEFAQCACSHFRHNKLRQGPCRHIVATIIG